MPAVKSMPSDCKFLDPSDRSRYYACNILQMGNPLVNIEDLQRKLDEFATERDWNQFHTPKNLAMALAGEAGELLEIFQWLTGDQSTKANLSDDQLVSTEEEIADVVIYALRLCDKLEIDLEHAILEKIEKNAQKYPVSLSKGNATRYSGRDD